jgi:thiazole synthase
MITVVVNGENRKVKAGTTIGELLKKLKIDRRLVVVELNYKVIKRKFLDKVNIKNMDNIEIVHFVGGGV